MLDLNFMRDEMVLPMITRFEREPNNISLAAAAIWAVDAYSSHAAFACKAKPVSEKELQEVEKAFKDMLCHPGTASSWKFEALREASNALKHATRKAATLVDSSALVIRDVPREGYVWYCARDRHWGPQVVVRLNIEKDEASRLWQFKGRAFGQVGNPFFNEVPVLEILRPSVELIEEGLRK